MLGEKCRLLLCLVSPMSHAFLPFTSEPSQSAGFSFRSLDAFHVLSTPIAQRPESVHERDAELGQGILDARWDLSKVPPRDDKGEYLPRRKLPLE